MRTANSQHNTFYHLLVILVTTVIGLPGETQLLRLTKENIFTEVSKRDYMFIYFYNVQDGVTEKQTAELLKACNLIRSADNREVIVGLFEGDVTPRIEETFKVYKFPKIIFLAESKRFPYSGGRFAKQIATWIRRIIREQEQLTTLRLDSKVHLATMSAKHETIVVYCGERNATEFKTFEELAADHRFIYMHSFNESLCRHLNLRRTGDDMRLEWEEETQRNMTDEEAVDHLERYKKTLQTQVNNGDITDEEMHFRIENEPLPEILDTEKKFNATLWEEARLLSPVIFIAQRNLEEPSSMKMIVNILPSVKQLRRQVKLTSTPSYYTDEDTFDLMNKQNNYRYDWLLFFYDNQKDDYRTELEQFKAFARESAGSLDEKIKIGVFSSEKILLMKVELESTSDRLPRLYYLKFSPNGTFLKHRMNNVDLKEGDHRKALQLIKDDLWDPYYFSEPLPIDNEGSSKKLVQLNYEESIQDRNSHLFILYHSGENYKYNKALKLLDGISDRLEAAGIRIKYVDIKKNDIKAPVEVPTQGVVSVFFPRDNDNIRSLVHFETQDDIERFLKKENVDFEGFNDL